MIVTRELIHGVESFFVQKTNNEEMKEKSQNCKKILVMKRRVLFICWVSKWETERERERKRKKENKREKKIEVIPSSQGRILYIVSLLTLPPHFLYSVTKPTLDF